MTWFILDPNKSISNKLEQNRVAWNGLESNKMDCWEQNINCYDLEQNGIVWNRVAWNGMGSNKMEC